MEMWRRKHGPWIGVQQGGKHGGGDRSYNRVVNRSLGDLQELREQLIRNISREASNKLKTLLEEKHIYQHVMIEAKGLISAWAEKARTLGAFIEDEDLEKQRFSLSERQLNSTPRGSEMSAILELIVGNVKLFCSKCGDRELYSPVWFRDMANELTEPMLYVTKATVAPPPDGFQLFYITMQCQRCLDKPEGFIVRRDGWRLSLHGRSPMEQVEVPKHIPKAEAHLFRDALIAAHGGKVLAALFYLRVFTEQFARRVLGETARRYGVELMEDYSKMLPEPQRGTMPSLRAWYEKLSEPIHAAREDAQLFEEAKNAIEHHFEIRRVYRMPETPLKPSS